MTAVYLFQGNLSADGDTWWPPPQTGNVPPSMVREFSVADATVDRVDLTWVAPEFPGDLYAYELHRDGAKLFDFLPAVLAYSDLGLTGGRTYTYAIYGRTEDYRYGPQSIVTATTDAAAVTGFTCLNPGGHPVNIDFAWNATVGATGYNLYYKVNDADPLVLYGSTAATSLGTVCGENTAYGWYVTASGSWGEGPLAGPVRVASGHYEQRNINSLHYAVNPATSSWRPSGWGQYNGDNVFQGSYGSSGYYDGVMTHDGPGFQNWCRNNYGQQVLDHLNANQGAWTECAIYVHRVPGSGYTTGGMTGRWNVSDARVWATGGPHWYAGAMVTGTLSDNQGGWVWLIPHWSGHVLLNQAVEGRVIYSFMIEWDDPTAYMQYYGASHGGSHTQLSARASWNFVTVNQQNSYYW